MLSIVKISTVGKNNLTCLRLRDKSGGYFTLVCRVIGVAKTAHASFPVCHGICLLQC